jgi:hypothetical protein
MTRAYRLGAATAAVLISASAALAQQPLQESPIKPGFWTWPREKAVDAQAIIDACQDKIAVQFADGRYFGLRLRNTDKKALVPPVVDEVGFCRFDPAAQIEQCSLRINNDDGTVKTGVIESKFAVDTDQTIKMTVTPKIVDGEPSKMPPFDVFPTPCPDAFVWTNLNGGQAPK